MKKILIIVAVVALFFAVLYYVRLSKEVPLVTITPPVTTPIITPAPVNLCFYNKTKTPRGLFDISAVQLTLQGDKVTGKFDYIPAEKDSKKGSFSGSVGPVDKMAMARTADVVWDVMAEGMQAKEQLRIVFGEGTAQAGFGEMVLGADGVYMYKDINKITYGTAMSDVDCATVK